MLPATLFSTKKLIPLHAKVTSIHPNCKKLINTDIIKIIIENNIKLNFVEEEE